MNGDATRHLLLTEQPRTTVVSPVLRCVVAVCCGVLRRVAVCCGVCPNKDEWWRQTPSAADHSCITCVAVCQRVAVSCSELPSAADGGAANYICIICVAVRRNVAVCCGVLRCVAVCCGVLQVCCRRCSREPQLYHICAAVCCGVLQTKQPHTIFV